MYTFASLKHVISTINHDNKNVVFDTELLKDHLQVFMEIINKHDLVYHDHGGSCLCFVDNKREYVYKFVMLRNNLEAFMNFVDLLKTDSIPHLEITEILYQRNSENILIYKQRFCTVIKNTNVNDKFMIDHCVLLKKILDHHILIPDTFYKNFCISSNKMLIYDYHDIGYAKDIGDLEMDFFYVNLLLNIRTYLDPTNVSQNVAEIEKLVDHKFCVQSSIIKDKIMSRNMAAIIKMFDVMEEYFRTNLVKEYNIYQYVKVNRDGEICLSEHTLQKYTFASQIITLPDISPNMEYTVLDAGCCIGGISLKLAQSYPNLTVHCNNITTTELNTCSEIANRCNIVKHCVDNTNIINLKQSFDITMYFAIIHHLLKSATFDQVINMVLSQTKMYTIIELPVKGDKLLDMVIHDAQESHKQNYKHLDSLISLLAKLSEKMDMITYTKINYGNNDLVRYAILLKIK